MRRLIRHKSYKWVCIALAVIVAAAMIPLIAANEAVVYDEYGNPIAASPTSADGALEVNADDPNANGGIIDPNAVEPSGNDPLADDSNGGPLADEANGGTIDPNAVDPSGNGPLADDSNGGPLANDSNGGAIDPNAVDPNAADPSAADAEGAQEKTPGFIGNDLPECTCGTETDEHKLGCPLGPQCDCGNPNGPHAETCPWYQTPVYATLSESIDALPSLTKAQAMAQQDITALHEKVLAVCEMFEKESAALTDEDAVLRFVNELGEERIQKYNDLFAYTDHFLATRMNASFSRVAISAAAKSRSVNVPDAGPPQGTPVVDLSEMGKTRWRIEKYKGSLYARRYNDATGSNNKNIEIPNGAFTLRGSIDYKTYGSEAAPTVSILKVMPDVTVTIYMNNVSIINGRGGCIDVSGSDTTLVLCDYSWNTLSGGYFNRGGALLKNGARDGHSLTIQCESWDKPGHLCKEGTCGYLLCEGRNKHAANIGSDYYSAYYDTSLTAAGFANFYIKGGIIEAGSASYVDNSHSPGIGSMCGNIYGPSNNAGANMRAGEICKNIVITGGRVTARGGRNCAGIGSGGWGGPVDGIHISGGAYVRAEGGINSPGIGSGGGAPADPGMTYLDNRFENVTSAGGYAQYSVSNITVTGGETVVEAIGSKDLELSAKAPASAQKPEYVPGIGAGISYNDHKQQYGPVTNVVATAQSSFVALVRQGFTMESSTYTPETLRFEMGATIDIAPDQYYTLVFFSNIEKTASVSTDKGKTFGPMIPGTEAEKVPVKIGDYVKYIIRTIPLPQAVSNGDNIYVVTDEVPAGMKLIQTSGTFTPGMTTQVENGVTKLQWSDQHGVREFFFTVEVESFNVKDAGVNPDGTRNYVNMAARQWRSDMRFDLPTNNTHHQAKGLITSGVTFQKVDQGGNPLGGAEFTLYEAAYNAATGEYSWSAPLLGPKVSTETAGITFDGLEPEKTYVIVETKTPAGYFVPSSASYILVAVDSNGAVTLTGKGDFADSVSSAPYTVTNVLITGGVKNAYINGASVPANGTEASYAEVKQGDEITYEIVVNNPMSTGLRPCVITDIIPDGLTYVRHTTAARGVVAVSGQTIKWGWDNLPYGETKVTVTVKVGQSDKTTFINRATVAIAGTDKATNNTYHRVMSLDYPVYKVQQDGVTPLEGVSFALSGGGASKNYRSGADGKLLLENLKYGETYTLVETSTPLGYQSPAHGSAIKLTVSPSGGVTLVGTGAFAKEGMLLPPSSGTDYYRIANLFAEAKIILKKVIANFDALPAAVQAELLTRAFPIRLSGDVDASAALKHGEKIGPMTVSLKGSTATVNVLESVPMEFERNYSVSIVIIRNDARLPAVNAASAEFLPGDTVEITVTNTFVPQPYFKAWEWVQNLFK